MNYGTNLIGRAICISHDHDTKKYENNVKFLVGEIKHKELQTSATSYMGKCIKPKVDSELRIREFELTTRKKRLKKLLEEETSILFADLQKMRLIGVTKANKCASEEIQEQRNTPEEIENLSHKLIDTEKYEEVNKIFLKQRGLEIKKVHELQIKEKKDKHEHEKKIDDYWHEIMINDVQNKKIQERELEKDRLQKISAMKEFLDSQIIRAKEFKQKKVIEAKEKELMQTLEIRENLEVETAEALIKHNKKKSLLNDELVKQIKHHEETIKKQKEEELHMENIFCKKAIAECKENKKKIIIEQELIRKEVDLFNEHLASLKAYRKAYEKKYEELIITAANDKIITTEHQMSALNQKRNELLKSAVIGREIQIKEKKQKAQDVENQEMKDFQNRIQYEKHLRDIEKLEKDTLVNKKNVYKTCLDEQMKKLKKTKDIEVEKSKKAYEDNIEEERKLNEKCLEVMNRKLFIKSLHPFTETIKKQFK